MAYQVRYWYTFRDINNQEYKVELLRNIATTITAEEIRGGVGPFKNTWADLNGKFQPVHSSGCEMNLLSVTSMKFNDLYTADMLEYQIKFYKIISSVSYLVWAGYMDSEMYREDFSETDNYDVPLTGNDGFNLLGRMTFVDSNGANYTGVKSQWEVLQIIFNNLGLPIQNLYVKLSTSLTDSPEGTNETIFHRQYCVCENFYNEDGEPETLRTILESILSPLGAFIRQDNGHFFICDINLLAKNTAQTFKVFSLGDYSYIGTESVAINIGDLLSIGFASGRQQLDIIKGMNKQVVAFSPYKQVKVFEEKIDFFAFTKQNTLHYGTDSTQYNWDEDIYTDIEQYEWANNATANAYFASMKGIGTENYREKDDYLKLPIVLGALNASVRNYYPHYKIKVALPYVIGSGKNYLKIECQAYVRTKNYLNKPDELLSANADKLRALYVPIQIYLGDYSSYDDSNGWASVLEGIRNLASDGKWISTGQPISHSNLYFESPMRVSSIAETWTPNSKFIDNMDMSWRKTGEPHLIPLPVGFQGHLNVRILQGVWIGGDQYYHESTLYAQEVRLKGLRFSIVDADGNEIKTNDIEYVGKMNPKYLNEGNKITLFQGTNIMDDCTALGSMLFKTAGNIFNFCKNWTREGITACVEKLLIRSIKSNDELQTVKLGVDVNMLPSGFGTVTYSKFLPGKVFMITGMAQNYEDAISNVTISEIKGDTVTIE